MESTEKSVRVDKWLWAVRLFKTRSQATDMCRLGRIFMGDGPVKPSREIKVGHVVTLRLGVITRTVKVKAILQNRVGAKLVPEYLDDLTPPEEYAKLEAARSNPLAQRKGRPTKRERRELDDWFGWDE